MTDMITGINSVQTRLRRHPDGAIRMLLREGKLSTRLKDVEVMAKRAGIPVRRVSEQELDAIRGGSHQGVALEVEASAAVKANLDNIVESATGQLLLLVLDGVTDARNLGACVRSAATMGVDAVIVPKDNSASMNAAAIKTASGGASLIPVIEVVNLSRCLSDLQQKNVWVVGTLLGAEQTLAEVDLTGHIAIVLGAEDRGLRQNTIKHCDFLARIPMATDELGFNVSVAAGICLYEAYRQREGVKK